jgi:mono/diheme cytochrome c family protein
LKRLKVLCAQRHRAESAVLMRTGAGRLRRFSGLGTVVAALCAAVSFLRVEAATPDAAQIEFFESKIRPIFAEHCYKCHSENAEKLKGELRLDTPQGLLNGGKSGPVIVAGEPDASRLIKAVRYTDPELQMPPKNKKLAADQIANLEAWVKIGAPLPGSPTLPGALTDIARARASHWAFQKIRKPTPPAVKNSAWVKTPVDNFVLALLEKKQLKPAPEAERRVLIRRVTYDLIGLPPTPEEVEAFANDKRPEAYKQLVERLLASPHYGERWGRYWLDVARYADTKGYLAGGEERRYAFSYTYRDYVIRAYNEDKPYDQFIIEQIAADKLPRDQDKRSLAALGFLTLGRRFLNNQNDIIDDRIDVVTRGTLGLTVACARCHDHKFDPIPTKDYYSLHGVFASSQEPPELPLLVEFRDSTEYSDYLKQKEKIQAEIEEFKRKQVEKFIDELRQRAGDYLLGAHEAGLRNDPSKFDTFAGEHKLNPVVLRRWVAYLEARDKKGDPIFAPWFELAKLKDFTAEAEPLLAKLAAEPSLNGLVTSLLHSWATNSLKDAADAYTKIFKEVDSAWKSSLTSAAKENKTAPTGLVEPEREALREVLYGENTPVNLPKPEAESILAQPISDGTAPLRNKIEALNWTHPGAPPRAMALVDRVGPGNSRVLLRGNPGTPGEEVPRRFLEVLGGSNRLPFTNGSGRLELARAIVSPDNPLTARVYVNRVWLHHFGEGLVRTPGDFGVRTEEPVQHDLLDYLAASFVEHGWSTKKLHRLIVLSATYQQSCDAPMASTAADAENELLSRMNRQRLDFEAVRDTLLAVAGKLDGTIGGLPVDLEAEPFSARRTVYGLIDRQNLPGVFRTFDFSNPDTSSQRRFHTTVPQQALFLMNSPFVIEQGRALAHRAETCGGESCDKRIQALYRLLFQRAPAETELLLGEKFLAQQTSSGTLSALERYAQVLMESNEVMFLD